MKKENKTIMLADDEALHIIEKKQILGVKENEDGTSSVTYIDVIDVKNSIEDIYKSFSPTQRKKIKWNRLTTSAE